jgi:allantoate deiminase
MKGDLLHRAEEVIRRCQKLARMSEDSAGTRRTFLSPPMRDCHREIASWLKPLGITPRIDQVGNLRAIYPAANSNARRLLIGSHLDTVPSAGAYDGVLGVVLAIALLEALESRKLPFAVEVIGFSEEEGVRFGVPFIGSRALIGEIDDELLARMDSNNISLRQAIRNFGLNADDIRGAGLDEDAIAYLEFHIEQGPVLESVDRPLAVVETIAGQTRLQFTFIGKSNHAGTTPMNLRLDALAAAAEWISAVERETTKVPGLVATVGSIIAKPNTTNVIPGEVQASLDVRHASDELRIRSVQALIERAEMIAGRRGLSVSHSTSLEHPAVAMDGLLITEIEEAIRKSGCALHRMMSGAGHDAMILAEKVPAAVIFLRSPGGISHDPAESVRVEDVAKSLECGLHLLDQLASSSTFQKRTTLA